MYELAFFGMLDVVAAVFLFHLNVVRSHNETLIHVNYAVVVYELFDAPETRPLIVMWYMYKIDSKLKQWLVKYLVGIILLWEGKIAKRDLK